MPTAITSQTTKQSSSSAAVSRRPSKSEDSASDFEKMLGETRSKRIEPEKPEPEQKSQAAAGKAKKSGGKSADSTKTRATESLDGDRETSAVRKPQDGPADGAESSTDTGESDDTGEDAAIVSVDVPKKSHADDSQVDGAAATASAAAAPVVNLTITATGVVSTTSLPAEANAADKAESDSSPVGSATDKAATAQVIQQATHQPAANLAAAAQSADDASAPDDGAPEASQAATNAAAAHATHRPVDRANRAGAGTDRPADTENQTSPSAVADQAAGAVQALEAIEYGGRQASPVSAEPAPSASADGGASDPSAAIGSVAPDAAPIGDAHRAAAPPATPQATAAPAGFEAQNHENIVTGIRSQLLPHGGSMQIRLDPPELGALQIRVEMRDGNLTASFQTSSDAATQLLSHSLDSLKHSLESQGVTIDRIQVQQAPRETQAQQGSHDQAGQDESQAGANAREEQQRRELLRRMWRKLSGANAPLDMVA